MNNDDVLEVAMAAYLQGDPADVSVNAITQMAGISKPSLYREFGSEDGLKLAVLARYAAQVLSDMFVILQAGMGLRETLDALINFACDDTRMTDPRSRTERRSVTDDVFHLRVVGRQALPSGIF